MPSFLELLQDTNQLICAKHQENKGYNTVVNKLADCCSVFLINDQPVIAFDQAGFR